MDKKRIEYNKNQKEIINNINQIISNVVSLVPSNYSEKNILLSDILKILDDFFLETDDFFSDLETLLFKRKKNELSIFDEETEKSIYITFFTGTGNKDFYISLIDDEDFITFGYTTHKDSKKVNTIVWERNNEKIYEQFIPIEDVSLEDIYLYLNENAIIDLPEDFFSHLNYFIKKTESIYITNFGDSKDLILGLKSKVSKDFVYTGDLYEFSKELQYFKRNVLSKNLLKQLNFSTLDVSYDDKEKTFKINDDNFNIELVLGYEYFVLTIASENEGFGYNISFTSPEEGKLEFNFIYLDVNGDVQTFTSRCNSEFEDEEEVGDLSFIFNELNTLKVSIPLSFDEDLYNYIYKFYEWFNYPDFGFYTIESPNTNKINKVLEEINVIFENGINYFFSDEEIEMDINKNIQIFKTDDSMISLCQLRTTGDDSFNLSTGTIKLQTSNMTITIKCGYDIDYESQIFSIIVEIKTKEVMRYVVGLDNNNMVYGTYPVFLRNITFTDVTVPSDFLDNMTNFVLHLLQLQND